MAKGKNKLSYRGVVYFYSQDDDGKRVLLFKHNAGTIYLAKLFAYMLKGEDVSNLVPDVINVYDDYDAPILVYDAIIQNRHVEDGYQVTYPHELPLQNYRAYFECMISKTQIRAAAANRAKKVVLLNKNYEELANIKLENSEFADVFRANDNLVIVWQMELIYDDIFEEVPDELR